MPTIVNRPLLRLKVDLLGTAHLLPTPPALARLAQLHTSRRPGKLKLLNREELRHDVVSCVPRD